MRRLFSAAVVAVSAALAVSGCTNLLAGHPVSIFADPFRVAGLPATDGPSGLRPDAAEPTRQVEGTDGGKEDELAVQSVSDVEEFWDGAYRPPLEGNFQPASAVVSWDSTEYSTQQFCGNDTYDFVNAVYCWDDNNIGWDRGQLLPMLRKEFGDISIPLVLGPRIRPCGPAPGSTRRHSDALRWSPSSRPTAWRAYTCAGWPRASRRASR